MPVSSRVSGLARRATAALGRLRFAQAAARSWVELTVEEQRAIMLILALFLLGAAVRAWHVRIRPPTDAQPPAAVAAPAGAGPAVTNALPPAARRIARKPSAARQTDGK